MYFCLVFVFLTVAVFFFFNDTATTEIYTLSLHDALPICVQRAAGRADPVREERGVGRRPAAIRPRERAHRRAARSEEHTSELQSLTNLVCRLLLEKKKKKQKNTTSMNKDTPQKK